MEMIKIVKVFHITSLMLWLGSLFVILVLLAFWKRWALESKTVHQIARKISYAIDLPLMVAAIATGICMLFLQKETTFKAGWFHMKMTGAILLIGIDCITRRVVKKGFFAKSGFWLLVIFVGALLVVLSSIYIVKK